MFVALYLAETRNQAASKAPFLKREIFIQQLGPTLLLNDVATALGIISPKAQVMRPEKAGGRKT